MIWMLNKTDNIFGLLSEKFAKKVKLTLDILCSGPNFYTKFYSYNFLMTWAFWQTENLWTLDVLKQVNCKSLIVKFSTFETS